MRCPTAPARTPRSRTAGRPRRTRRSAAGASARTAAAASPPSSGCSCARSSSSSARAGACRSTARSCPRSVEVALRKRPIQPERVERMVSGIVRQLESMGEQEVPSSVIGELVMEALKGLDPVAYVRFASVYRDFREAADFHEVLGEIAGRRRRPASLRSTCRRASHAASRPPRESTDARWLASRVAHPAADHGSPLHAAGAALGEPHARADRAQSRPSARSSSTRRRAS